MKAKEMFKALGYERIINNNDLIEYTNDILGDGDYLYVIFNLMRKDYEVGYYDGYDDRASRVTIKEHEAITKQMKELGWI